MACCRDRCEASLDVLVPSDPNKPYDMHEVIDKIVDDANFFEIMPDYAGNLIVGFARFEGVHHTPPQVSHWTIADIDCWGFSILWASLETIRWIWLAVWISTHQPRVRDHMDHATAARSFTAHRVQRVLDTALHMSNDQGARFVRFCDAFNIPLVTLVDVPGFLPGTSQVRSLLL